MCAVTGVAGATALDDYFSRPDDSYSFALVETHAGPGYTEYHFDMASQRWRDETEIDRPLWEHRLILIVPDGASGPTALLRVAAGSNGDQVPAAEPFEREWALATNTVVASLLFVPNKPLVFICHELAPCSFVEANGSHGEPRRSSTQ